MKLTNLTGADQHNNITIDKNTAKIFISAVVFPKAGETIAQLFARFRKTMTEYQVSISRVVRGNTQIIFTDIPLYKLMEFAQAKEGSIKAIVNSSFITFQGFIDLTPSGYVKLDSQNSLVFGIRKVHPSDNFTIYIKSEAHEATSVWGYEISAIIPRSTNTNVSTQVAEYIMLERDDLKIDKVRRNYVSTRPTPDGKGTIVETAMDELDSFELDGESRDENDICLEVESSVSGINSGIITGADGCHIMGLTDLAGVNVVRDVQLYMQPNIDDYRYILVDNKPLN